MFGFFWTKDDPFGITIVLFDVVFNQSFAFGFGTIIRTKLN